MNALLTLMQTIDPVVVAKTYSLIDGEVDKKSVASITRGVARSHAVPDAEEMIRVLAEVTARDDTAIVTGHFDGLPDGENVDVVTRKELARLLGVDETDDERLAGLHDFNGKLHAARLNVSIAPGFWALLDFDNPPGMPEEWAVLGIAERLAMMERVLPGVSTCERIELRSSSSRVVRPGGLPGPASHAWVRLSDAQKVVVLRGYLRVQTVVDGLSFVSPHYDRKTGEELPRIDHRTLFDLAVFSPERLVFCAKPQISAEMVEAGYTVADADIRLVNAGNGSLDVSKIELPPASSLRTYKAETGEELKLSINGSGLRTESHGALQWDTPITSKGKTKTLKEWVEDMPTSGKIRCEAPFRASQSEAAFIRLGSDGKPFVYDSCGGIKYVLPMFPGSSEREAAPVDLRDVPDQIPGSANDAGDPQPSTEKLHPYLRFEIPETDTFMAPEFVLDGIMIAGSVILAGGWGVGKTSQLVPLLFRAAHLCAPDDPLRPLLRRRVVYISEDVEQVRQIVRSMRAAGELDGISKEEVEDYFKVVSAVRMKPEEIIKVAKPYAGLAVKNNSPATGVSREAHALVVFDTRSACIDLDDESDNTEAGRVMATLRQGFPDNPQLIVGHIAKALKKADAGDLSGRGAGAWEADAQQVLYLVEKDGERWLDVAGPKHRFVASVDGIAFETVRSETNAIDPLGRSVTMQLVHGKPRKVQLGQRAIDKARLAEENEREARNATRAEVLTLARELHEAGAGCNRARLKKDIKRQSKVVVEMIDELLDEGWLLEMPIEASARRHPSNAHYLFPPSPSERDAYLRTGVLPPAAHQPPLGFVKPG